MAKTESAKQPQEPPEECGNCKHYDSHGGKTGVCRKHPPQVTSVPKLLVQKSGYQEYTHVPVTEWPVVKQDDRCGEFDWSPGKRPSYFSQGELAK